MILNHRAFASAGGIPILLIHGLLGSSRNWLSVAKDLSKHHPVYAIDLRNHGESSHSETMDYEVLVDDIVNWIDTHLQTAPVIVGHSLGGKTAMAFACKNPEKLSGLIVADIAPKDNPAMLREFDAMAALDLKQLKSRSQAEELMRSTIPELAMRRFLLTNLVRNKTGCYEWSVNLPVLQNALAELARNPLEHNEFYDKPTLFIRGGRSHFVPDSILGKIKEYFRQSTMKTIEDAGHNVHVDAKNQFVNLTLDYIKEL